MLIVFSGLKIGGRLVNWMIPRLTDADPDNIGSHFPFSTYHSTGIDVEPKVTAHLAFPNVGTAGLL